MRIVLLLCLALLTTSVEALTPAEIFGTTSPSIVVVRTYSAAGKPIGTGSGVVVQAGIVVTNCHVLQKAQRYLVERNGEQAVAILVKGWPDRDLCLMRTHRGSPFDRSIAAIESPGILAVGKDVFAIGAPRGLELTMSRGIVSSLRPIDDGSVVIQTDAAISPGSSGGGLFDEYGRLVGITTFQMKEGQNLNFALPANWVLELLASAGIPFRGASSTEKEEVQAILEEIARDRERHFKTAPSAQAPNQEAANRLALERQMRASEEQRRARERAEFERRAATEAADSESRQVQQYALRIVTAVRSKIIVPPGVNGNAKAEVDVTIATNGLVTSSKMITSSGHAAYDAAIYHAIDAAQPLPIPSDPEMFQRVSELRLVFRPGEGTLSAGSPAPASAEAPISRAPPVQISPPK